MRKRMSAAMKEERKRLEERRIKEEHLKTIFGTGDSNGYGGEDQMV